MRIVVTGGAGFVGRHMTKRLCDLDYDVTVVDNMVSESAQYPAEWSPHLKPRKHFHFYNRDCRQFFQESDDIFDMVIHLAALVGGRLTIENQPLSVAEDLAIDAMMFNWAVKTGQKKVVFLSSSAAYPTRYQQRESHQALNEKMIDLSADVFGKPDLTYGWAKLTGEYLAKLAYERHGLKSVCFRPFSGYGEDQHLTYPYPSLVRKVIKSRGVKPVEVWGTGEQTRDLIYVDDCVDAILRIASQIDNGQAVNLGTGKPTSFIELIKTAWARYYGGDREPAIVRLTDKPEGVFYRVADPTLMQRYGYIPASSLEDVLDKTFEIMGSTKADCGCWL